MASRDNNFDLIRLVKATQVLVMHALAWLKVPAPLLPDQRLAGHHLVRAFAVGRRVLRNRALRILPSLWACLALSYAMVALRGGLGANHLLLRMAAWLAANRSMFKFTRAFGTGVANGALWSIATEVQFYPLIPLVGLFGPRAWRRRTTASLLVVASIGVSSALHAWPLAPIDAASLGLPVHGFYIYHMPVIYALLHHELSGGAGFAAALILVPAIAAASWLQVERPMLRRTHYSALPVAAAA